MIISIRSMKGSINNYRDVFEKYIDYDKHYNIFEEYYDEWRDKQTKLDELKDVDVTLEDLVIMFKEIEDNVELMGFEFAFNISKNAVYVFNTWVE